MDSKGLGPDDEVGEILRHGTLSIGFIGLAETPCCPHRQAPWRVPARPGTWAWRSWGSCGIMWTISPEKTGLNFTLLATPAEGLSGRFVRMDTTEIRCDPGRHRPGILHQQLPRAGVLRHSPRMIRCTLRLPTMRSPMPAISPMWSWTATPPTIWRLLRRWYAT